MIYRYSAKISFIDYKPLIKVAAYWLSQFDEGEKMDEQSRIYFFLSKVWT